MQDTENDDNDLQAAIASVYARVARERREWELKRAEIERTYLESVRQSLIDGTYGSACLCLSCVTAVCDYKRPDLSQCTGPLQKRRPVAPEPEPEPDICG